MLDCAGMIANVFSVEQHHWVAEQLTKEQPGNKTMITITIDYLRNPKYDYLSAASEPPAASAIDLIRDILFEI